MSTCDWCGAPDAAEVTVEPARYRRTRDPRTGLMVDECTRLAIKAHACPTHARLVRDEAQPSGGGPAHASHDRRRTAVHLRRARRRAIVSDPSRDRVT